MRLLRILTGGLRTVGARPQLPHVTQQEVSHAGDPGGAPVEKLLAPPPPSHVCRAKHRETTPSTLEVASASKANVQSGTQSALITRRRVVTVRSWLRVVTV